MMFIRSANAGEIKWLACMDFGRQFCRPLASACQQLSRSPNPFGDLLLPGLSACLHIVHPVPQASSLALLLKSVGISACACYLDLCPGSDTSTGSRTGRPNP